MTKNLLETEISPYLLQHKENPVHWQPWGTQALKQAKQTNKPILLSIGYAACHWCHVMAHESFEDPLTADVMNKLFINIKVDREERPDIDKIYMNAIHIMGEQGGWPLTMFLTPTGDPYWGGTYFPKTAQYGRPGFIQVLTQMAEIHNTQPENIKSNTEVIKYHLNSKQENNTHEELTTAIVNQIAGRLVQQIDFINGGLKGAPKFPQTNILDFLRRTGNRLALSEYKDAVIISLTQMCQGGIYDHLGGGFSRYSVDERWLAPHFEKMLYDNALILDLLIVVFQATSNPLFKLRIEETITWLQREMTTTGGAFSASLDADSEGIEGKFYVWEALEIKKVLKQDFEYFAHVYDISKSGNWEQTNILNRLNSKHMKNTADEFKLSKNRKALLNKRDKRIRPGLDDKVLSDWNGLMIATLAYAATTLKNANWLEMAKNACDFITRTMIIDGHLYHAARVGKTHHLATSEGYANMIRAYLALHQATNDAQYLDLALELNSTLYKHYWNPSHGGYYFTADFAESLIIRTHSGADDATPNANGIMAQNLIKLYLLTANQEHLDRTDQIFSAFTHEMMQNIFSFASLLVAFDMRTELLSVVLVPGEDKRNTQTIIEITRATMPATAALLISSSSTKLDKTHPQYGKLAVDNRPTVYICHNNTCTRPIVAENEIIQALKAL